MSRREQNIGRLLQDSLSDALTEACWQPHVDVYQAGAGWLVKFDLAGVRPSDIQVELSGRRLTVRGERRDWTIREGQQAYSMEIAYNRFERVVQLPLDLEKARLASEYRDGMFLVSITPIAN
jgi:HSP20 family protein